MSGVTLAGVREGEIVPGGHTAGGHTAAKERHRWGGSGEPGELSGASLERMYLWRVEDVEISDDAQVSGSCNLVECRGLLLNKGGKGEDIWEEY